MRPRLLRLLLVLPLGLLAACATERATSHTFYHVSVLNLEGGPIASWTARGDIKQTSDRFYRFEAVEHTVPNPARTYHYPLGWRVSIAGPRVVYYRTEEPAWLRNLTALDIADRAEYQAGDPKELAAPRPGH